jgi:hypothetical protein
VSVCELRRPPPPRPSRCLCLWPTAGMFVELSGWSGARSRSFVCVRERERLSERFVSGPVGETHTSFFLRRSMLEKSVGGRGTEPSRVSGGVRRSFFSLLSDGEDGELGQMEKERKAANKILFSSCEQLENGLWIEFLSLVGAGVDFCLISARFSLGLNFNFGSIDEARVCYAETRISSDAAAVVDTLESHARPCSDSDNSKSSRLRPEGSGMSAELGLRFDRPKGSEFVKNSSIDVFTQPIIAFSISAPVTFI